MQTDHQSSERRCVACGYNLYGLGEEPRCPECGLLNVPEAYRRQVWELVDSGKWFFSGFFSPFKKRPPGWWWSLDRPGDVKRSVRFATYRIVVALGIVAAFSCLGAAWTVEQTTTWTFVDSNDPSGAVQVLGSVTEHTRFDRTGWSTTTNIPWQKLGRNRPLVTTSVGLVYDPSLAFVRVLVPVSIGIVLVWLVPAQVGLWTQIRKGLPAYARALRTIVAASCLEAHRLIYLAAVYAFWVLADLYMRTQILIRYDWSVQIMMVSLITFGAIGWIGSLRSDYTRQLVRSRLHAIRVFVMYALFLPAFVAHLAELTLRLRDSYIK